MLGLTFTNSALDDNELPREAIRKIEEGDVTAPHFATTDSDSVVKNLTSTDSGAPTALLHGLFEQAVASDKILGDAIPGENNGAPNHSISALGGAGWKQAVFAENDSISFLAKFNFTKDRHYQIDADATSGNTATTTKTITINGKVVTITAANETSDPSSKMYIIKLLAKTPSPVVVVDAPKPS